MMIWTYFIVQEGQDKGIEDGHMPALAWATCDRAKEHATQETQALFEGLLEEDVTFIPEWEGSDWDLTCRVEEIDATIYVWSMDLELTGAPQALQGAPGPI